MIKRLRLQVVAICMLLVASVLLGALGIMYASFHRGVQRSSQDFLRRVISEDPTSVSDTSMIGGSEVHLPYFTVDIFGGSTAYVTGGTYSELENSALLSDILQSCVSQNLSQGTVAEYNLRYLRVDNGFYQRIAFVDMSMESAVLKNILMVAVQICVGALAVLLGVSLLLAWLVTRPVELAWRQQHQFLSDASHELKTPLTVILSNAELLSSVTLEERPARWVDNLRTEAVQMKSLVEEMLTLARADNMVRTSVFSAVSLSDAAGECAMLFEAVAYEAGKPLVYDDISPDAVISGDGDKVRQVISILLDNAVKYGAEGQPIALQVQKTDRHARLTVSNKGAPIPPEQLARLFERFYRADASRGEQSGFGLGLSIAASIAAEHHGSLRAESDADSTRFILTLPLSSKKHEPRSAHQ